MTRWETDSIPKDIHVSTFKLVFIVLGILWQFYGIGSNMNLVVQYLVALRTTEFFWTLGFILIPAFVNTAVSVHMYNQDDSRSQTRQFNPQTTESTTSNDLKTTRKKWLRILVFVPQMTLLWRLFDILIYAIKSRLEERKQNTPKQKIYFVRMLEKDADAAMLRIFKCFLEGAPQKILQVYFLLRASGNFQVSQILLITGSVFGMGWCLGSYNRVIRYVQEVNNMKDRDSWIQAFYHFFILTSRIASITAIACLFPYWTILACFVHVAVMATLIQIFDRSPFCAQNRIADIAFTAALGAVYIFTYILPVNKKTMFKYILFYSLCFVQNLACGALWFVFVDDVERNTVYFLPILWLTVVPYVVGTILMVIYYAKCHPKDEDVNLNYFSEYRETYEYFAEHLI